MVRKLLLLLLFALASCGQDTLPQHPLANANQPPYWGPKGPIRLALVLGAGGSRGLAHVGVLEELEEAGLKVDLIVACSAGSIVGALYADQPNIPRVRELLLGLQRRHYLDINWLSTKYGLAEGRALERFLEEQIGASDFSDLKIPLLVVATDLQKGELVCLGSGPIVPAVRASSSYPFVFHPVPLYGRTLVDGGVIDPLPVEIARKYHAELVLAVDTTEPLEDHEPQHLFSILKRCIDITYFKQGRHCVQNADFVIRPEVQGIGAFDDENGKIAYEAGRKAAREMLPRILETYRRFNAWREGSSMQSE